MSCVKGIKCVLNLNLLNLNQRMKIDGRRRRWWWWCLIPQLSQRKQQLVLIQMLTEIENDMLCIVQKSVGEKKTKAPKLITTKQNYLMWSLWRWVGYQLKNWLLDLLQHIIT